VVGRPVEELPRIVTRICGVCPASHHLAGSKAVDGCFGARWLRWRSSSVACTTSLTTSTATSRTSTCWPRRLRMRPGLRSGRAQPPGDGGEGGRGGRPVGDRGPLAGPADPAGGRGALDPPGVVPSGRVSKGLTPAELGRNPAAGYVAEEVCAVLAAAVPGCGPRRLRVRGHDPARPLRPGGGPHGAGRRVGGPRLLRRDGPGRRLPGKEIVRYRAEDYAANVAEHVET